MLLRDLWAVAGIVVAAVTFIVIGDTAGKLMAQNGVAPSFVAWSRFLIAALIFLPFSGLRVSELAHFRDLRVFMRGLMVSIAIFCMITALKTEPIANVFGAFFISPIIAYLLAILFLGERPSVLRSLMLALGFAGVMLVVKPGFGATIGIFFALIAGTLHGAYLALTRYTAGDFRPRFLLVSQLMIGAVLLAPGGLSAAMPDVTPSLSGLVLLSAGASALGNYMLVIASRRAEASLIAPLVYSQLISATLISIFIFDEWPDHMSLIGLVLIFFSGVATLVFQHKKHP